MRILMSVTTWAGLRIQADLAATGHPVTVAEGGMGIFECLDRLDHPVVLLETGVPDLAWRVALEQLRDACPALSILVIDSAGNMTDRTGALELGADDVLDDAMRGAEVAARILAVAMRRAGRSGPVLDFDPAKPTPSERRMGLAMGVSVGCPHEALRRPGGGLRAA